MTGQHAESPASESSELRDGGAPWAAPPSSQMLGNLPAPEPPKSSVTPTLSMMLSEGTAEDRTDLDALLQASPAQASPGSRQSSRRPVCDVLEDCDINTDALGSLPHSNDHPETQHARPVATSADCKLEDQEKFRIYVHHRELTTVVGWPADMSPQDVQKAVLCACDCMQSGGVQLLELLTVQSTDELQQLLAEKQDEVGGKLIKIHRDGKDVWYKRGLLLAFENFKESLKHDQLYLLEQARERDELTDITGDQYRRLLLQVPALSHVEAQKAVAVLRQGANLIKRTRIDQQHFRFFQLSADLKRLLWYSGRKAAADTTLNMSDINEIKITRFTQAEMGAFENVTDEQFYRHCSFTIITKRGFIQLCAKDEEEFDVWVTGLKALAAHFHDVMINKVQLLGHSRRFRAELEVLRGGVIEPPERKPGLSIQGSMLVRVKTREEARRQLALLTAIVQQQKDAIISMKRPDDEISGQIEIGEYYCADETATMTDRQLEYWQAAKFVRQCEAALKEVESLLQTQDERALQPGASVSTKEISDMLELVAQKLWEINVNVENIGDMINRLTSDAPPLTLVSTLNVIQEQIDKGRERLASSWAQFTENVVGPTMQKLRGAPTAGATTEAGAPSS